MNKKGTGMEVRACSGCRRLFNYLAGEVLCPECKKKQETKFQEVRNYIDEHENVTMKQVSEDCEVTMSQIENWIREERLHVEDEENAYFYCENCGKTVHSGRYCSMCKRQLLNELGDALGMNKVQTRKKRKKDTPRMRFIRR